MSHVFRVSCLCYFAIVPGEGYAAVCVFCVDHHCMCMMRLTRVFARLASLVFRIASVSRAAERTQPRLE